MAYEPRNRAQYLNYMDSVRLGAEKKKISRFSLENVTFDGPDWNVEHQDVGMLFNPQFIEYSVGYYKYLTVQRYSTSDAVTALVDFCEMAEKGYSIKGVTTFQEFDMEKRNQEKQVIDEHIRLNVNHNNAMMELGLLDPLELVDLLIEYVMDEGTVLAPRPTPFIPSEASMLVGGFVSPKLDGKATRIKTIDSELHYYIYDHWCPLNGHKFDLKSLVLECEAGEGVFVCYDVYVEKRGEKIYARTFSPIYFDMITNLVQKIGCDLLQSQRVDMISHMDKKILASYTAYTNDGLIFRGLGGLLMVWKDIYTVDLEIKDGEPILPEFDFKTKIVSKEGLHSDHIYEYGLVNQTKVGGKTSLGLYHVRARRDKIHPNDNYEIARYVAATFARVSLDSVVKRLQIISSPTSNNNSAKILEVLSFKKNLKYMDKLVTMNEKQQRKTAPKRTYEYNTHDPPRRIKSFIPFAAVERDENDLRKVNISEKIVDQH
jgi:hypothetical protein